MAHAKTITPAQAEYNRIQKEIYAQIEKLQRKLEKHQAEASANTVDVPMGPGKTSRGIHWGHVGDLSRIRGLLIEINQDY